MAEGNSVERGHEQGAAAPAAPPAAASLRLAGVVAAALLALCAACALQISSDAPYNNLLIFLTLFCAQQDAPIALGIAALLVALTWRPALAPARATPALRPALVIGAMAALVAAVWLIRTRVLFDHDFTRDEHMAVFDAMIFRTGRAVWPFPPALRPFYSALNDLFTQPIGNHEAWVSNYLPVNAALRGYLSLIMPMSLVSPLQTGLAGLVLWRIAVRLWPADGATHRVVLACFIGSSQVLLTGTAAFAMTTHLLLNLVWLALFLRGTRAGHAGAMVTGFFATGIHQPIFHPLFVLPFLDLLRRQRRWRLLASYCVAYGAIGLVWMAWPGWLSAHGIGTPPGGQQFGFLARLAEMLVLPNITSLLIMAGNLLRFVTWQHVLAVPLALVAIRRLGTSDDLVRALELGAILTLVVMTLLIPPQGHGWGYRYLHGFIGSLCLLAGFGWRWLAANGGVPVRAMAIATAFSLLVLAPIHTLAVRGFIAPYARAVQAFQRVPADYVVVDSAVLPFGTNFVVNRPDLSNRPLVLLGGLLWPVDLARLCPGRTIAFADAPAFVDAYRFYHEDVPTTPSQLQQWQRRTALRAGCRVITAPVR